MNTLNSNLKTSQSLTALVTPETFVNFDSNLQIKMIETVAQENTERA